MELISVVSLNLDILCREVLRRVLKERVAMGNAGDVESRW